MPLWIRGAGAGAGAAVAAVAVHAARGLISPSFARVRADRAHAIRCAGYLIVGVGAAALIGPCLVLALLACGVLEVLIAGRPEPAATSFFLLIPASASVGGIGALC
jgi:chromate transporter